MNNKTKTAKFLRKLEGFTGDARLYELSEAIEYDKPWDETDPPAKRTKFIVVSATFVPYSGAETYIFPADKNGNVIEWGELNGSYRGGISHATALKNAGFARA